MDWPAKIAWDTPSGKIIQRVCSQVPSNNLANILVFGSAALQLTVTRDLLSADVDLAVEYVNIAFNNNNLKELRRVDLQNIVRKEGLAEGQANLFVQVCSSTAFETSPVWGRRAMTVKVGHVSLTIPHPFDILIGKLHRLESKDIEAFEMVIHATGHPTSEEFRQELQQCSRLFEPRSDDSLFPAQHNRSLFKYNVSKLWPKVFGKTISVSRDILEPINELRANDYRPRKGGDLKKSLIKIKRHKRSTTNS